MDMDPGSPPPEIPVKCEIIEISDEEVDTNPVKRQRKPPDTSKEALICDVCAKSFSSRQCLRRHMALHTGDKSRRKKPPDPSKRVQCEVCAKMFGDKHQLRKHMIIHTGERPFICGMCGNTFRHKHSLKAHELAHNDTEESKIYPCTECGASFKRGYTLRLHLKIHSGEKNYKCHLCDKAFVQKANLTQHIKAHKDERDFECDECHKKFITRSKLKQHYQKHVKKKLKEQNIVFMGSVPKKKTSKPLPKLTANVSEFSSDDGECPSMVSNSPLWGSRTDADETESILS